MKPFVSDITIDIQFNIPLSFDRALQKVWPRLISFVIKKYREPVYRFITGYTGAFLKQAFLQNKRKVQKSLFSSIPSRANVRIKCNRDHFTGFAEY